MHVDDNRGWVGAGGDTRVHAGVAEFDVVNLKAHCCDPPRVVDLREKAVVREGKELCVKRKGKEGEGGREKEDWCAK